MNLCKLTASVFPPNVWTAAFDLEISTKMAVIEIIHTRLLYLWAWLPPSFPIDRPHNAPKSHQLVISYGKLSLSARQFSKYTYTDRRRRRPVGVCS